MCPAETFTGHKPNPVTECPSKIKRKRKKKSRTCNKKKKKNRIMYKKLNNIYTHSKQKNSQSLFPFHSSSRLGKSIQNGAG